MLNKIPNKINTGQNYAIRLLSLKGNTISALKIITK
jgi:hypothetical protein